MKKANIKYYFSLLTFLLATTGVALSKNCSSGESFNIAIFGEAQTCNMENCNCCDVQLEYFHVADNFVLPASEDIQVTVLDLLSNFNFHIDLFNLSNKKCLLNRNQKLSFCYQKHKFPPPSEKPALTQNFRC